MRFLVIGCGSIGKRHIRNLIGLGKKDIIAYDPDKNTLDLVNKKFGVKTSNDINSAIRDSDAALICSPNHMHTEHMLLCIKNNKDIFVEKPISHNLDRLDMISKKLSGSDRILQVGCNLRFHPILKRLKKMLDEQRIGKIYNVRIEYGSYLPNWRPGTDYSKNYGAKRSMGGGIILDDIHEIDYAYWLFGPFSSVFCKADKISDLKIDTEDNADIIIESDNGYNINIHMDYLQKSPAREFRIIGENGIIKGDINKNEIGIFVDAWEHENTDFDYNQTYVDEIEDFIRSTEDRSEPAVGIKDGINVLKVALAAKRSAETGEVTGL